MSPLALAKALSLGVPLALLAGAYGSEHIGGLSPCELCWWQRWAHWAAAAFAFAGIAAGGRLPDKGRSLVWLAALAILVSGKIALYHAGVEAGIFEGFTQCTADTAGLSTAELLDSILSAPMVRCDEVQWAWLGVSMAGWNAILSLASALVILWLSLKKPAQSD
ncbi:MAG: disulfide bond formation protein B [Sphingosinicella sp.]